MAVLANHNIIAKIKFLTRTIAISDKGKVLENDGAGWGVRGNIKESLTPQQAVKLYQDRLELIEQHCPAYIAFKTLLHKLVPQTQRYLVLTAVKHLGNDIDGLWAEMDDRYDMRGRLDLSDCQELVRAYQRYQEQAKEAKPALDKTRKDSAVES